MQLFYPQKATVELIQNLRNYRCEGSYNTIVYCLPNIRAFLYPKNKIFGWIKSL